uniref:Securin n=1 Tax=Eptatretus burgeri TaxID=7764 RepID=A0A8C4N427_EPTBU
MSDLHLIGTENFHPATPLPRSRLGSVPGSSHKTKPTLPASARRALSSVNVDRQATPASKLATPALKIPNVAPKKFVDPGKVPSLAQVKEQEWPEIEKCIPWDPLEAEIVGLPEEHAFGDLPLAGLPLITLPQFETSTPSVLSLPSPEPLPSCIHFGMFNILQDTFLHVRYPFFTDAETRLFPATLTPCSAVLWTLAGFFHVGLNSEE